MHNRKTEGWMPPIAQLTFFVLLVQNPLSVEWSCPQLRWVAFPTFVKVIKITHSPTHPPRQADVSRDRSGGLDPVNNIITRYSDFPFSVSNLRAEVWAELTWMGCTEVPGSKDCFLLPHCEAYISVQRVDQMPWTDLS